MIPAFVSVFRPLKADLSEGGISLGLATALEQYNACEGFCRVYHIEKEDRRGSRPITYAIDGG